MLINSTNVVNFEVGVNYNPFTQQITITNLTTYQGGGAAATEGIDFVLISPSGLTYYENDLWGADSDITPTSPNTPFTHALPTFEGAIEWGVYSVYASIKDDSTVYDLPVLQLNVCKTDVCYTVNNEPAACADINFTANCQTNKGIYADNTVYTYKSTSASSVTYDVSMRYPIGSGQSDITNANVSFFSTSPVYNGTYQFTVQNEAIYEFDDNQSVTITYVAEKNFEATCAQSLCGILCAYDEYLRKFIENQGNGTANAKLSKYSTNNAIILNSYVNEAIIKYQCGEDLSLLIEKIEALTGSTCDCQCGTQNPTQGITTDTNIVIQSTCGDISIDTTQAGNTTTFTINDVTTVVESDSSGITVTESTNSGTCTNTFTITACLENLAICTSTFGSVPNGNGGATNVDSGDTYNDIVDLQSAATINIQNRLIALEAQLTWTNLSNSDLQSGWTNFIQARYGKNQWGQVELQGYIDNLTPSNTALLFTLPIGYRPSEELRIGAVIADLSLSNQTTAILRIQTNGAVNIYFDGSRGHSYISLTSIRFNIA